MTARPRQLLVAAAVCAVAGCGMKGNPLAPLRPVPAAISDLAAERLGEWVTLTFTIPATNADRSEPPSLDRVEVYVVSAADAAGPPPTMAELMTAANLRATIPVARGERDPAAPADPRAQPGSAALHRDRIPASDGAAVRYYTVLGATGRRKGRPSPMVVMPLGPSPAVPTSVLTDFTEKTLTVTWRAAAEGHLFHVEDPAGAKDAPARRLTSAPIAATELALPVEFGKERCFIVRAVTVTGAATVVGDPSTPACRTPVDRFPPPAPAGLIAAPAERGIDLVWSASIGADVAGYIVLRGDGANGTLQPLTPAPITATRYLDDNARSGQTYAYAVVAVDRATPPNASEPSERFVITARRP